MVDQSYYSGIPIFYMGLACAVGISIRCTEVICRQWIGNIPKLGSGFKFLWDTKFI